MYYYNEEHTVTFTKVSTNETRNSWTDWRLIPSSRPVIAQASYVEKYIDVPGRDGQYDLTDWLLGNRPSYTNRQGNLEFYVDNNKSEIPYKTWEALRTDIANFLNGTLIKMVLADDPEFYYQGRCRLSDWKSEANRSRVVIEYRLEPYKTNSRTGAKSL